MPQFSLHLSDDADTELERGAKAQNMTRSAYVASLVLRAAGRVSGLSDPVWESAATDTRMSGFLAAAVAAATRGDAAESVRNIRLAQRIIIESLTKKRPAVNEAITERIGIANGTDSWEATAR